MIDPKHPLKVVVRAVAVDGSTLTDDSDHVEISILPSSVVDDVILDVSVLADDNTDQVDPSKRLVLAVDRDQLIDALIKADVITDAARALLFKRKPNAV